MQFDMNGRSLERIAAEVVQFPAGATRLWFGGQPLQELADPRVVGTRFPDSPLVHPPLVPRIISQAASLPPNGHDLGGKKVRDHATWNLPEMRLLSDRALLALCMLRGATQAHVVDRWANVIEPGDYSTPHCHYESEYAAVYFLDPGSEGSSEPDGGEFVLIDSRIPFCCPSRPERPTRGILPTMAPGTLLLFPAEFLHYVKPYRGRRPRITLAWNISVGPPPPSIRDFSQPVAAIITKVN